MIYNNILEACGNTPLIRLNHLSPKGGAMIYGKYEGLNVGGSIKTRSALNMIEEAEKKGLLNKDSIIVEASSGNQGVGLSLVGAVKNYKVVVIMPDSVSGERRKLIEHYGAEIVLIHDDGDIGKCIEECNATAKRMAKEDPNVFLPRQFENPDNVKAQRAVAEEILKDLPKVDGFCSGIGTGGTITGIGQVLKENNPDVVIWAVEPEKAAILSGKKVETHIQMGIGDGLIPDILDQNIYSDICIVTDEEAVKTAKRLAKEEGIMAGISSGTNVTAAIRMAEKMRPDQIVVTVLADTAERYYSTELFEE